MRLHTLLETTEEDRALISLSAAIYKKLAPSVELGAAVHIGRIGDVFDTPLVALEDVSIDIQSGDEYYQRAGVSNAGDLDGKESLAFWDEDTRTIVLNAEYLGRDRMQTTITHELRHALDAVKANSYPGGASRYFTPKKKEHRKDDPYSTVQYRAMPAEINARFIEVLDKLSQIVPKRYAVLEPNQLRPRLVHDLNQLLNKYEIVDLFPEKTASPDYKRLMKRAYDFIKKEMDHYEAQSGTTKRATGNW